MNRKWLVIDKIQKINYKMKSIDFLIASITPIFLFTYFILKKDKNKEPYKLLIKSFIYGAVIVSILSLLFESYLDKIRVSLNLSVFFDSLYNSFITAALPEEGFKFLILYYLIWRSKYFDENIDGIVYAVCISMGFALTENLGYLYESELTVAIFRGVLSVPLHGFCAVLMGYYFSIAKLQENTKKRNEFLLMSIGIPIIFHCLYDFALMYTSDERSNTYISTLLMILFSRMVILLWRIGIQKIKYAKSETYSLIK